MKWASLTGCVGALVSILLTTKVTTWTPCRRIVSPIKCKMKTQNCRSTILDGTLHTMTPKTQKLAIFTQRLNYVDIISYRPAMGNL